ncbi:MAG: hypothetical protein M0P57_10750 [Syntrophales bacterium]|jgi:flagellar motility protein MotE (MotC chaperone)|nr:hypothetical protein [Syntrophales bacterium]MDY0043103.1 hypothetical protein [Syntrophales bacterium]
MKKMIVIFKILVICVLIAKIFTLGGIWNRIETVSPALLIEEAGADPGVTTGNPSICDAVADPLSNERKILTHLINKQTELAKRKEDLIEEKKRLMELKAEILTSIETLSRMKEEITVLIHSVREVDELKYRTLAKVYEATPPEQAGAMFKKLDKRTVAAIIMRMKSKSAGEVWGHIDPGTAAEITKEITRCLPPSEEINQ